MEDVEAAIERFPRLIVPDTEPIDVNVVDFHWFCIT
jgi:hypothetical protein